MENNTESKEQGIKEGNKLIAEFMGFTVYEKRYPRNHGIGAPEAEWKDCILEKLKYHKSWDQLMPVVEKISKLRLKFLNAEEYYNPYPRTFAMPDEEGNFMVRIFCSPLFTAETLLEATWLAVVDFILNNSK